MFYLSSQGDSEAILNRRITHEIFICSSIEVWSFHEYIRHERHLDENKNKIEGFLEHSVNFKKYIFFGSLENGSYKNNFY